MISEESLTDTGLSFKLTIGGFYSQDIVVDNTVYKRISIPGYSNNEQTGHPELPLFSKLIAILQCSGISITLTPLGNPVIMTGTNVYPKPDYIEQQVNDFTSVVEQFSINNQIYASNYDYPSVLAIVQEVGALRGQRLASLIVYPMVFNPISQTVTIYENYTVSIVFQNPIGNRVANIGLFGDVVKNAIMNHDDSDVSNGAINNMSAKPGQVSWYVLTSPADADQIDADYIIITAGKFFQQNNMQSETYRIAHHRAMFNGYKVGILNVENIVSDAVGFATTNPDNFKEEQRIRECIKRIYNNGLAQNTLDGHLGYVLIIGDAKRTIPIGNTFYNDCYNGVPAAAEVIWDVLYDPPPTGNPAGIRNDYYYSCLTQSTINGCYRYDYFGDVAIGRFPADNHVQLYNMVEKTIKYETEAQLGDLNVSLFTNGTGLEPTTGSTTYQTYFAGNMGFYNEYLPRIIKSPYESLARDGYRPETNYNPAQVTQDINNGKRLYCYYGHSDSYNYGTGFDTVYFQSNLNNAGKWPFFFANSCLLGYYEDTPYNQDCFAEVLPKYSAINGFIGSFASATPTMLDYSPQTPIVPTSFYELFVDNLFSRMSSVAGHLSLLTKTRSLSMGYWPYLDLNRNKIFGFNLFCDPAINLFAQGYEINRNLTLSGDIVISNPIHLKSGYTLTLNHGTHIYFINNGSLTIDQGATLKINSGSSAVYFHGTNIDNALIIKGNLLDPFNMVFTANATNQWYGLLVINTVLDLSLNATVSFTNCGLRGIWNSMDLNGVAFNKSWLSCIGGHLNVQNSTFNDSFIVANHASKSSSIQIKNCSFNNLSNSETISIDGYPVFNIEGNNISFAESDAISLYNCGSLPNRSHFVVNNSIDFAGNNNGTSNGIKLYNSLAKVQMNTVMNCPIGISLLNLSNVELSGTSNATNSTQTQRIINNKCNQIYLSELSAPPQISYNAIFRDDITTSPYIYYDSGDDERAMSINVNYNYWGGTVHGQFIPSTHLQPYNNFVFNPTLIWNLPYKSSSLINETCIDSACSIYWEGIAYIEDSLFDMAVSAFKSCIEVDTGNIYALLSMKQLFSIASYTEVFTLEDLKVYYETNPTIQQSQTLKKAAEWLSYKCSLLREEYNDCRYWLNSVIQSPELLADSIFAEIELGFINSMLLPGIKAGMRMEDLRVINQVDSVYNANRQSLIWLLYGKQNSFREKDNILSPQKPPYSLVNLYPNPAHDFVSIEIFSKESTFLSISLLSINGREYNVKRQFKVEKGINTYSFSLFSPSSHLSNGLYFIKLYNQNYSVYYPIVKQ